MTLRPTSNIRPRQDPLFLKQLVNKFSSREIAASSVLQLNLKTVEENQTRFLSKVQKVFTMPNNTFIHFKGFFEDHNSKLIFVSLSTIVNLIDCALCGGIVWFERYYANDRRILTNKIVSFVSILVLAYLPVVVPTDIANYLIGPLNADYCFFFQFYRAYLRDVFFFYLNCIVVARYVFIFWLKNPTFIDDEFWSVFICIEGMVLTLIPSLVAMMVPQKHSFFYYACSDTDPLPDYKYGKLLYSQIEILVTLVIHVVLIARIKFYRLKVSTPVHRRSMDDTSLASLALNLVQIIWGIAHLSLQVVVSKFTLEEANQFPNYLFMYAYHLLLPPLSVFVVSIVYYIKHQHLRAKVFEKFKELLRC